MHQIGIDEDGIDMVVPAAVCKHNHADPIP
jgi:hypothetical protein